MPLWVTWILVPLIVRAQSGDVDPVTETRAEDPESRLFCTSHISVYIVNNNLTCSLVAGYNEDDEDQEDSVESITVCSPLLIRMPVKCWSNTGSRVSVPMQPLCAFNVTVRLRRGGVLSRMIDLRRIVKPKTPQVWNAIFHPQKNYAAIHIRSAYTEDFLKPSNQVFQFKIWNTADNPLTQNVTDTESWIIEGEHLTKNTTYHVAVRAIPRGGFSGTWSDWSKAVQFDTNSTKQRKQHKSEESQVPLVIVVLLFAVLLLAIMIICLIVKGKNISQSIRTYMWPNIPTLSPIYKQVKLGFEMSFEPEQFSHMNIQPMKKIEERPSSEVQAGDLCLDRELLTSGTRGRSASDTSDYFTGESASTQLSLSSTGRTSSRSGSPSPSMVSHPQSSEDSQGDASPEANGPPQPSRDAVYVTMSSFYHSKDQVNP